jgi:hypothetical protein
MKNVGIIWTEKLELRYKQHFVENKTDILPHVSEIQ